MKKILSILGMLLLGVLGAQAQAPAIFNYQGVARNSVGNVLVNKNITLRLTIHDGAAAGPVVYQESRAVTTNPFGLFNVQVGSPGGTSVTGTIAGVNWGVGNKYIQVEIDPNGGTTFINIGTAQMASVPYAWYTNLAGDLVLPFDKTQADAGTLFRITNSGTGAGSTALEGRTNSTANSVSAIIGTVTPTGPGGFSTGVRGINNGTGGLGIGVWGSQNGSGWGVYGQTPSGIGVYGASTSGFGLYGSSTSGTAVYGLSNTGRSGFFENTNAANSSVTLSASSNGTGWAGQFSSTNATTRALRTVGGLQLTGINEALNRILASDAAGNATWQDAAAIGVVTGSGTLNFVPKWTPNGTNLGNSQLFDNGTNMGIGTITPTSKLQVEGLGTAVTVSPTWIQFAPTIYTRNTLAATHVKAGVLGFATGSTGGTSRNNGVVGIGEGNGFVNSGVTALATPTAQAGGFSIGILAQTTAVGPNAYAGYFFGRLNITDGTQGAGRVYTSDAGGNGSWQPLGAIGAVSGTGTLNRVAKWTPDGFTIGNSQMLDNGQTVTLGTSPFLDPNSLTVSNTPGSGGNATIELETGGGFGAGAAMFLEDATSDVHFTVGSYDGDAGTKIMTLENSNLNVGIGTATPQSNSKLNVDFGAFGATGSTISSTSSNATNGNITGVYGLGGWYGVQGINANTQIRGVSVGVRGIAGGSGQGTGYGLMGIADGTASGNNYGLYATASNASGSNFAAWLNGRVAITDGTQGLNRVFTSDASGNGSWQDAAAAGLVSGSGTLNYIPKWTPDGVTLGNSMLQDNGNAIKLGVSAFYNVNSLNIYPTPSSAEPTLMIGDLELGGMYLEQSTGYLHFTMNNPVISSGTKVMTFDDVTFNVGVGTTSATARLHSFSNSGVATPQLMAEENDDDFARLNLKTTHANNPGNNFWAVAGYANNSSTNERFNIYNDVSGNLLSITGDGQVGIRNTSFVSTSAGLVVNTSVSPGLQSAIRFWGATSGTANGDGIFFGQGGFSDDGYMWNYENNPLIFGTNGLTRVRVEANGNVGIGIGTNAAKLTVSDATVANNVFINEAGFSQVGSIDARSKPASTVTEVFGIYGFAENSTTGNYGIAADAGTTGGVNNAFFGRVFAAPIAGTSRAIRGLDNINSPNTYAGYFSGKVQVNGDFTATGVKAFTIDHPLDPENKVLRHFATESNEVLNKYSGNAVTGADGKVTVKLPDYFEAVNKDFRYQLTVIGSFAQAIISKEISNNEFEIATSQPNLKVSWEITGVRNDPYMKNVSTVKAEEEKADFMKGKYLSPKAYNQPASKGVDYNESGDGKIKTQPAVDVNRNIAGPDVTTPRNSVDPSSLQSKSNVVVAAEAKSTPDQQVSAEPKTTEPVRVTATRPAEVKHIAPATADEHNTVTAPAKTQPAGVTPARTPAELEKLKADNEAAEKKSVKPAVENKGATTSPLQLSVGKTKTD